MWVEYNTLNGFLHLKPWVNRILGTMFHFSLQTLELLTVYATHSVSVTVLCM